MDFSTAVQTCFSKFIETKGRASRSEYWWFILFVFLMNILFSVFLGDGFINFALTLILFVPTITASARRFHDLDKSAYWAILCVVPLLNILIAIFFFTRKGTEGANQYGPDPLGGEGAQDQNPHAPASQTVDAEPAQRADDNVKDYDGEADEDNPWVKARREKAEAKMRAEDQAAKTSEASTGSSKEQAQKQIEEEKKKRIEPPRFGRDAAKKDK